MNQQSASRVVYDAQNPDPTRWKALAVIGISQLMIVLDASIMNLALPSAKRDLGITDANQQWVITAYTLAFGGLLLLGGRIADYVGRKRAFVVGLVGFAIASAIGGLAPNEAALYASRALQGVFGALLAPAALSLLTVTFLVPKERARAFGVFGAVSGGGAAVGVLLGGALTEYASWRWCLAVNAPIAIFAALMAMKFVRESKATGNTSYDIPGAITATGGLLALVYGFAQAATFGWGASETTRYFILAIVLLTTFFVIESKVENPLLPLRIILDRNRGGAYLVMLIAGIALFVMFLFIGLYLQVIKGFSPIQAGLAFLPFSAGIILSAGFSSQMLPKVGARPLMALGLGLGTTGFLLLSRITPDSSYVTHLLPGMLVMSFGMANIFIPVSSVGLHNVGGHDAGVASALINTSQQVGGSLGTALLNTIATSTAATYLAARSLTGPNEIREATVYGFSRAFQVSAGFMALALIVSLVLIRVGKDVLIERPEGSPVS